MFMKGTENVPNSPFRHAVPILVVALSFVVMLCGCWKWGIEKKTDSGSLFNTKPKLKPTGVLLEIAIAEIPNSESDAWEEVVSQIDVQELPIDFRKRLDENGLAVGTLPLQLPSKLYELLEQTRLDDSIISLQKGSLILHQKIQKDIGESYWIQTGLNQPELHWTMRDGQFDSTGMCNDASPGWSIESLQVSPRVVQLRLVPEIQYDAYRRRIDVKETDFAMLGARRKIQRFDALALDISVRHGQTLVLWNTDEWWGLGADLFMANPMQRRILLIRIVQTHGDDLFTPNKSEWILKQ